MTHIQNVYNLFCTERFPLPTADEVQSFESDVGMNLPLAYKRYLLDFNGGVFSDAVIHFDEPLSYEWRDGVVTQDSDELDFMYGFHATLPAAEIGQHFDLSLRDASGKVDFLPIGYTTIGGLLMISLSERSFGFILIHFPSADVFEIARNLDAFFGLIRG